MSVEAEVLSVAEGHKTTYSVNPVGRNIVQPRTAASKAPKGV